MYTLDKGPINYDWDAIEYIRYNDTPLLKAVLTYLNSKEELAKKIGITVPTFNAALKGEMSEKTRSLLEKFLVDSYHENRDTLEIRQDRDPNHEESN